MQIMLILILMSEKLSIIMFVIGETNASVMGWAPHTDDDSLVFGLGVYALVGTISKRFVCYVFDSDVCWVHSLIRMIICYMLMLSVNIF